MATLAFKINELKKVIEKAEQTGNNTILFHNTGSISVNNSSALQRQGYYLCDLSYNLLDDPNEEGYWPEVRHKFVISKKNLKNVFKKNK